MQDPAAVRAALLRHFAAERDGKPALAAKFQQYAA